MTLDFVQVRRDPMKAYQASSSHPGCHVPTEAGQQPSPGGRNGGPAAIRIAGLSRPSRNRPSEARCDNAGPPVSTGLDVGWERAPQTTEASLALVLGNQERFLATATRLLGERDAANDVVQAAYLKALTRGGGIRDPQQMLWWFGRVLSNTAIDFLRRREAHERLLRRLAMDGSFFGTGEGAPEDEAVCGCVIDLLETLKPSYARMLRHVDLDGRSLAEAAEAEGLTTVNARVRLHRARRTLRARVIEACGASPLRQCVACGHKRDRSEAPVKYSGSRWRCNAAGGLAYSPQVHSAESTRDR